MTTLTRRTILATMLALLCMPLVAWAQCEQPQGAVLAEQLRRQPGSEVVSRGLYYINERELPDSAMLCFSIVAGRRHQEPADTIEQHAIAVALNLMGQLTKDVYHDYQMAYTCFVQAEQQAWQARLSSLLPLIHNNLLSIELLNTITDPSTERALHLIRGYRQVFREATDAGLHEWLPVASVNLATTGMGWHLVDSVRAELNEFLADSAAANSQVHRRLLCQGVLAYGDGRYADALSLFRQSCDSVQGENRLTRSSHLISAHLMMLQMLLEQGLEQEAEQTAQQIVAIAEREGNSIALNDVFEVLYNYYQDKPDPAKASAYELLYLRAKDAIMTQGQLVDMDKVRFLYELERMEQEARDMARRHAMQSCVLYGVLAFMLVVVVMLVLLFRQYRQVKAKNRQLYLNSLEQLAAPAVAVSLPAPSAGKAKYQSHVMAAQEREELLHRIFAVMEQTEDVYTFSFSLQRLAELVDANPNYVSQVINEHYGRTFNSLLSEYRVKEACRRMNDEANYGHLTLESIAQSVGIKSRTNFSAVFKQQTGLTPSEYLRQARRRQG